MKKKFVKSISSALGLLLLLANTALAQTGCPSIVTGAVLTAAQWQACFQAKQDNLNFLPLNRAGGVMTGPLITTPGTTGAAPLRVSPGVAPSSPVNGDLWTTSGGVFARINGSTLTLGVGAGPFANTAVPSWDTGTSTLVDSGLRATGGTITTGAWAGTAVPVANGGTGSTTAGGARTNLGLGTMATQAASAVAITGGTITGMGLPSVNSDVANKQYVDSVATGLRSLTAALYATAAALPNTPTYSNGASGVGATLTAGANAAIVVDGVTLSLNDRVVVKDQASALQNGVYSVTTVGSGAAAWVLTRVTDFDQAVEMISGTYILVTSGNTNAGTSWVLQTTVTTVGTDALNWNQFASQNVLSFNTRSGAVTSIASDYAGQGGSAALWNVGVTASIGSSALTITLTDRAGSTLSSTSPAIANFRSSTLATGTQVTRTQTSALALTVSSGSRLGVTSGVAFRLWIVLIDDAGTLRIGVIKASTSTQFYNLDESVLISSTAEGGAGAADSAGVFYTDTAVSSKAFRVLATMTWETGLAAAGTWTAPTQVQLYTPQMAKPGQAIGPGVSFSTATGGSCTTSGSYQDSILTAAITPSSAANYISVYFTGNMQTNAANSIGAAVARRGGNIIGIGGSAFSSTGNAISSVNGSGLDLANTASAITYTVACLSSDGTPVTFPGNAGGVGGGGQGGLLVLTEIAG